MAYSWIPRYGELVKYGDQLYFYQGNGTSCYLYRTADHLGSKSYAVHRPASCKVRQPTADELRRYKLYGRDRWNTMVRVERLIEKGRKGHTTPSGEPTELEEPEDRQ